MMETLVIWSVAVCRRTECTAAGRHRRDRIQAFGRDGGMEIMYLVRGDHRSLEYRQSRVGECGLVRLAPRPVFAREVAVVGRRSAPSETVALSSVPTPWKRLQRATRSLAQHPFFNTRRQLRKLRIADEMPPRRVVRRPPFRPGN
jgi:hypothetical protein